MGELSFYCRAMEEQARREPAPWLRALIIGGGVALLLYLLRGALTPILSAFFIAYLLDPLVDKLESVGVPRALASVVVLTGVIMVLVLFFSLTLPTVVRETTNFLEEVPERVRHVYADLTPWLTAHGLVPPQSINEAVSNLDLNVSEIANQAAEPIGWLARELVGQTASILGAMVALFLVPVLSFYALNDFHRTTDRLFALVPPRHREMASDLAHEVHLALSQFVRGQLTVMLILGVMYAVGFSLVGVRLAVIIGAVAALLSAIPYLGGASALSLALLMCALDFDGWAKFLFVGLMYAGIQVVDGFFITPKILGDHVGMSALWVLIAVLIFGDLFGFFGVLLAVPTTAVLKILLDRAVKRYVNSDWYRNPAKDAP